MLAATAHNVLLSMNLRLRFVLAQHVLENTHILRAPVKVDQTPVQVVMHRLLRTGRDDQCRQSQATVTGAVM